MRRIVLAGAALVTALVAAAVPAQAATGSAQAGAARLVCANGYVCLYDGVGNLLLVLKEGCWFNNIGLQGYSDRTRTVANFTRYPVNLANWNGHAWEHILQVPAGHVAQIPYLGLRGVDAVHSIC